MKKALVIITIIFLALPVLAEKPADKDAHGKRLEAADRYLKVMPPKNMFLDLVQKMSAQVPREQQKKFIDLMTKNMDLDKFSAIVRETIVKHFTAEELNALADFYGSPVGKSAMSKFGQYMADIMPQIQSLTIEAVKKTQGQMNLGPAPKK